MLLTENFNSSVIIFTIDIDAFSAHYSGFDKRIMKLL